MSLEQALKILRETDAGAAAPAELESQLRTAFVAHHRRKTRARRLSVVVGAIAASLVIAVGIRLMQPPAVSAPEPVSATRATAVPSPPQQAAIENKPALNVAPARPNYAKQRRAPQAKTNRTDTEIATDFLSIPYAPAMTVYDRGQVIRVNIPASSMRSFGLPVPEDRIFGRVRADVLMGEDGIARAIRFVQ
jgi:hypothetical protein